MQPWNGPKRRLPSGFEYPVHELAEPFRKAAESRDQALADIEALVGRQLVEKPPRLRIVLSREQASLVQQALRDLPRLRQAAEQSDDLWCRDVALHRLWRERGPRAVVRALGWSSGRRGATYQRDHVVEEYLILLGREPRHGLLAIPQGPAAGEHLPDIRPEDTIGAIRAVAKTFRFASPEACRQFLLRARGELRREEATREAKGGEEPHLGHVVSTFPLPNPARLARPVVKRRQKMDTD
jgi:hypothetical protein